MKNTLALIPILFLLIGCKETKEYALAGIWKIHSVSVDGYDRTEEFQKPQQWLHFHEDGSFQSGANRLLSTGHWLKNNTLLDIETNDDYGSRVWKMYIGEEFLSLRGTVESGTSTVHMILTRIEKYPDEFLAYVKMTQQIAGKWEIENMTVNGENIENEAMELGRWVQFETDGVYLQGTGEELTGKGRWRLSDDMYKVIISGNAGSLEDREWYVKVNNENMIYRSRANYYDEKVEIQMTKVSAPNF